MEAIHSLNDITIISLEIIINDKINNITESLLNVRDTKTFRRWISSKVENDLVGKDTKDVELLLGHKNSKTKDKYITYNFKNADKIAKLVHSTLN